MSSTPAVVSADALRDLAARAATLQERISGEVLPALGDPAIAERRLAEWRRIVARGETKAFADRLALDGLDEEQALAVLGDVRWPDAPLPPWTAVIAEASERLDQEPEDEAVLAIADPVEGLAVALPFVRVARARIADAIGPLWTEAAPAVRAGDEQRLAIAIGWTLRTVIDQALRAERDRRYDRLSAAIMLHQGDPPCDFHDAVIDELAHAGFVPMLLEHAVVARAAARAVLDWVDGTAEFHQRLAADVDLLAETFNDGTALGPLERYGSATSDAHGGGRSVRQCAFASGCSVMYKPKPLASEVVYERLAELIGRDDEQLRLRAPHALDRGVYGWSEFVCQEPARDAADVERYSFRAGVLLALMHGIGGSDLHMENLIAAQDQPVVIDTETLLGAAPQLGGRELDAIRESEQLGAVVGIGILPQWVEGEQGRAFDISALGARETQETVVESLRWKHPGTDAARLELGFGSAPPQGNVLLLDGEPVRCEDHAEAMAAGFAAGYRRLQSVKVDLTADEGPLAAMRDTIVRCVVRPTRVYGRAMRAADHRTALRHGVDRSLQLEIIVRPVLDAPDPQTWIGVVRSELAAMENGDIPTFAARGAGSQLDDEGVNVELDCSPIERAAARLRLLDEEDLALQLRYVRMSLLLRGADATHADVATISPAAALDGARALAEGIAADAQRIGESVIWIAPERQLESGRWRLSPAGMDVYSGFPGVLVALAAYARVADDRAIAELVRSGLRGLLDDLERKPSRYPPRFGISISSGCAGLAIVLDQIGRLLDDSACTDAARVLLDVIGAEHVAADTNLDLISGSAGLLHAATRLGHAETAALAATHLERHVLDIDGAAGWRSIAQAPLTGTSHGSTGIAGALVQAGDRFGQPAWVDLGRRGLLLDDARYDATRGGWPDLRDHVQLPNGSFPIAGGLWCHGAAGFALTYGALLRSSIAAEMDERMERATVALAANPITHGDHLCCGGAGWAEAARTIAPLVQDDERRERLEQETTAWRGTAAGHALAGTLALQAPRGGVASRSVALMSGRSGVLWALLAAEHPSLEPFAGLAIA